MGVKTWKKIILGATVLGILIAGGGCMCLPLPGHGGSDQGHVHAAAPRDSAYEAGKGTEANRPDPGAGKSPASSLAAHHGQADPRNPWIWLAGAGMAAMMALMLL